MAPAMALALVANFGSVQRWREEFVAMAKSHSGDPGRVLLCFQPHDGSLVNQWAAGHGNAAAASVPILVQAGDSIESFVRDIDWDVVYERYQAAVHAATEDLAVGRADVKEAHLLDVRRAGVFEQAKQMIPNSQWRDPAAVDSWAAELPRDQEVVVYCVYGHEVGRRTALRLRSQGFKARFLSGGIDGWAAAGLALVDKPAATALAFGSGAHGAAPDSWQCGSTGGGSPKWSVELDAPGGRRVLKQSGEGRFPWCVKSDTSLADGWVEVKFKPVSGKHDQAGGIVWRWQDGDNYYIARANALENNVSLYCTKDGSRRTIQYVDAPVPTNTWHALRVEFAGTAIRVSLNGQTYIEVDDAQIAGAGKVGVWTKADSVTLFDAFTFGAAK